MTPPVATPPVITRRSATVRAAVVLLAAGVLATYGVLYVVSGDLALLYPHLAHLRLPLLLLAAAAGAPVAVLVPVLWRLAEPADGAEPSTPTVRRLLLRARSCLATLATTLLAAFLVATKALAPDASPTVLLAWCVAEAVTLVALALVVRATRRTHASRAVPRRHRVV